MLIISHCLVSLIFLILMGESQGESGICSYYGKELRGNPTASGERFDPKELTAAHKSLQFGTNILVTNHKNGKSVRVRVNDRGPFVKGRIIDLSYEAARRVGMLKDGIVPCYFALVD